jgi:hypothetical protein
MSQSFYILTVLPTDLLAEDEDGQKKDTDVLYEAAVLQGQRMLDDEHGPRNQNRRSQEQTLQLADDDSETSDQRHFKMNLSKSQKNRIKETTKRELSHRDKMTIPDAASVKDVWKLTIKDRWRLYRRWITHLSGRYRNIVTRYLY